MWCLQHVRTSGECSPLFIIKILLVDKVIMCCRKFIGFRDNIMDFRSGTSRNYQPTQLNNGFNNLHEISFYSPCSRIWYIFSRFKLKKLTFEKIVAYLVGLFACFSSLEQMLRTIVVEWWNVNDSTQAINPNRAGLFESSFF